MKKLSILLLLSLGLAAAGQLICPDPWGRLKKAERREERKCPELARTVLEQQAEIQRLQREIFILKAGKITPIAKK